MQPALRVLLIEDDEEDYLLTRDLLLESKDTRFHLDWVSSYAEAIEHLERGGHDVYLVDYHLGTHDGLELLKHYAMAPFPMIMLTGEDTREVDLAAMRHGARSRKAASTPPLLPSPPPRPAPHQPWARC